MSAAITAGTALLIGGGLAAAGTVAAGAMSADATKSATNAAITQQQSALTQQSQLSQPYRDLGSSNIDTYQKLLTGGGGPNAGANIEQTLQQTPGYQATLTTGTEAAERSAAASGLNLSGNQVAGVEQFGAQLGDQTYQQQLNNLLQPIQLGQAAAAGQAANVGTSASNISNALIGQGNNTANIDANTIAGITKAGSNATNSYLTYNTLQGLNNPGGGGVGTTYGGDNFDGSNPALSTPTYNTPPPGLS